MKVRVFEVATRIEFLSESTIEIALSHRSIQEWAYILHGSDTYTQAIIDLKLKKFDKAFQKKRTDFYSFNHFDNEIEDFEKTMTTIQKEKVAAITGLLDKPVPPHWHVVCHCPNQVDLDRIAKWFNVPPNQIEVPKGRGAFLDKVKYLTHEDERQQKLGKHLYPDEEVHANFDWRKELNEREAERLRFGKSLNKRDRLRSKVLYDGLSLRDAEKIYPLEYMNDISSLQKYRLEYIRHLEPPMQRTNFYICGNGGYGKGILSRGLARCLYPEKKDDREIFFEVGAKGAPFEGYDGQPVLIWNDYRNGDLIKTLGDRGNVFNVFETHPTSQRQNVKYSSVNLCNAFNIVNSVQPYKEFLNGLAGEYTDREGNKQKAEDKGQVFRRFNFVFHLIKRDEIEVIINQSLFSESNNADETKNYLYMRYCTVKSNLIALEQNYLRNREKLLEKQKEELRPITHLIEDCRRTEQDKVEEKPYYVDYSNQEIFDMSTAYEEEELEKFNSHEPDQELPF